MAIIVRISTIYDEVTLVAVWSFFISIPQLHRQRRAAQAAQQQGRDQQERKSFFHNASSPFISNGFMFEYTRKPSGMYPGRLQHHAN